MQGTDLRLMEAVERERQRLKMSQRAFSQFLGIDPAHWHRIRAGERPLTLYVLTAFMQKLPELTPEVTAFIVAQGDNNQKEE